MQRTFIGIFRNIMGRLCRVVFLNRNRLLRIHVVGAFQVLLRLQHRGLLLKIGRFRRTDRCLLLFDQRLIGIGFDLHQQITLFHGDPIVHRQLNNLARDFRRNLHFSLRLNFSRCRNYLDNSPSRRFVRCHRNGLFAFTVDDRADDPKQKHRADSDQNFTAAAGFPPARRNDTGYGRTGRYRGGWTGYLLVHGGKLQEMLVRLFKG